MFTDQWKDVSLAVGLIEITTACKWDGGKAPTIIDTAYISVTILIFLVSELAWNDVQTYTCKVMFSNSTSTQIWVGRHHCNPNCAVRCPLWPRLAKFKCCRRACFCTYWFEVSMFLHIHWNYSHAHTYEYHWVSLNIFIYIYMWLVSKYFLWTNPAHLIIASTTVWPAWPSP